MQTATLSSKFIIMEQNKTSINNNYVHNNDVYYEGNINVPFSWEYKPGLSKINHQHTTKLVLQPPPCPLGSRSGGFRVEEEDPFVEAYKKCTKSPFILQRPSNKGKKNNNNGLRKYMHILSCKYSVDVSGGKAAYN